MQDLRFWDITPCSALKVDRRFGGISNASIRAICVCKLVHLTLLATCFILFSCSAYPSPMKMQDTCSSVTSVDFQWTTRLYIREYRTLQGLFMSSVETTLEETIYSHYMQ
jgi:hypothetical protein